MSRICHIGLAVPDLKQTMAEFGPLFEPAWTAASGRAG
jgi:hypothetical protein